MRDAFRLSIIGIVLALAYVGLAVTFPSFFFEDASKFDLLVPPTVFVLAVGTIPWVSWGLGTLAGRLARKGGA